MITKEHLADEFGVFQVVGDDIFYASESTPNHKYNYWFSSSTKVDYLVATEDLVDSATAELILRCMPAVLTKSQPHLVDMCENKYGFTHVLAVPGDYHGYMKGYPDIDRDRLFLCVPIKRFEFSGTESAAEFRSMNVRIVKILDWARVTYPKAIVYFDNPQTGGGTKDSVIMTFDSLLLEIRNLNGVANGFIELTNFKGEVIELLSPAEGQYKVIRNRSDVELVGSHKVLTIIERFLIA